MKAEHIEVLRELSEGRGGEAGAPAEMFSKRLLELRIQGLVEENKLTEAGKLIVDAFKGVDVSSLEDPVLNSEIIKILELLAETGEVPERWMERLRKRALDDEERAKKVLEAYAKAKPSIFITPYIVEFVLRMPPGPGILSDLTNFAKSIGYGYNIINALEAMRWIKISPETRGRAYTLTPLGRRIREILTRHPIRVPNVLLDKRIVSMLARTWTAAEEQELVLLGLVAGGEATPLARELVEAYNLAETLPRVAPTYVTREEIRVLSAIEEARKKGLPATQDWIERKAGAKGDVLHVLESKGWIVRREVKGKDTYEATEDGRKILEVFGGIVVDLPADAVKAITFALAGDVPIPEWVQEAKKHGLVAGDVTKKGRTIYEIARRMPRLPILTGYDAAVLARTPRRKGIHVDQLVREVAEYVRTEKMDIRHPRMPLERSVRIAISEAESRGYVFALQNGVVRLTRAGDLMKSVLEYGKTREMIHTKFAITPTTYHIARTIAENENRLRKLWREIDEEVLGETVKTVYNELKRYTSITVEEVFKYLIIMKRIGLLGDMGLTKAGKYLVEVGEALRASL